jgi:hypothetical protein
LKSVSSRDGHLATCSRFALSPRLAGHPKVNRLGAVEGLLGRMIRQQFTLKFTSAVLG